MPRRMLTGLFIVGALLLASCGDDSGSVDQDAVDAAVDDATGSDGGSGDGGNGDAFFTGDCTDAVQAFNGALASAGAAFDPNATGTPEDTAALLDEVAAAAPDEIADDFAVLAGAYAEFAQALADSGVDFNDPNSFQDPEALAALNSLGEIFGQQELEQASNNIEAWFDANCG